MQEKICQTCLGLGSHPGENPDVYGYMSVNCESCFGGGILADHEDWEIIELNKIKERSEMDAKKAQAIAEIENQFRSNKHGFK